MGWTEVRVDTRRTCNPVFIRRDLSIASHALPRFLASTGGKVNLNIWARQP